MRWLPRLPIGLLLCATLGPLEALGQEPTEPAADKPVATVLARPVYLKDLAIVESDKTALRDYFAIARRIMPPLVKRYVKEHNLTATAAEMNEVRDFIERPQSNPDTPDTAPRKRPPRVRPPKQSKRPGTDRTDPEDEVARSLVESWKFNRALYDKYGGRVVFQQFGLEPLDAYRDWLRDEEKAGHYQIHDSKWKAAFGEYTKDKYHRFLDDPEVIKVPFWRMEPPAKDDPPPKKARDVPH